VRYIAGWLDEMGVCGSGMSGPVTLPWHEMQAWAAITGTIISNEEARIVRALSQEFVSQYHKSNDADCPPPFAAYSEPDHDSLAKRIKAAFRAHSRYRRSK